MIVTTVTGNLGKDAETKTVGSNGDFVASFSVASSKKVKGETVTQWVNCSLWGKRGEALAKFLKKGTPVTVVGELSARMYDGQNEKGLSVDLRVQDIALQGGKREEKGDDEDEIPF